MAKLDLNFHQTFAPEREHLARLLTLADKMPFMTKEEIFAATGIPTGASSGKVIPHIRYAEYMGLLNVERQRGRYRLSKTDIGHVIARRDPFLVEPASQLLCHYCLTSRAGAPLWNFVFREYVPTHGHRVNREDVERSAQIRFGTKVNLTPFASCYTRDTSFGPLGLLRISRERAVWCFVPHHYDPSFRYLYAYLLFWEWDRLAPGTREVTLRDISSSFAWGEAFLWGEKETLEVLSLLQELGALQLNRQLEPVTVIRTMSTDTALNRVFSLLG